MGTKQETLAQSVEASQLLFIRFLAGFDEHNRTKQAPHLPNHAAWTLGHLALTMQRAAEKIDRQPLPGGDFRTDSASSEHFDTESVCFGSVPADVPARYPSLKRAREIFDGACSRLAGTVRAATDARLDEETPWGAGTTTLGALVMRMCFHNGTHAGQLIDLRRAFGMPPVIRPRP